MNFVREVKLPHKIYGIVVPDIECNYNIYINQNISFSKKYEAIHHELRHIERGDCFSERSCFELEEG